MKHIDDPPTMSIKPCPDPAHTLCFRTFHRQSPTASAAIAIRFQAARFEINPLPQHEHSQSLLSISIRFRASQSASKHRNLLPSNLFIASRAPKSLFPKQLRFRHFNFTASAATSVPGQRFRTTWLPEQILRFRSTIASAAMFASGRTPCFTTFQHCPQPLPVRNQINGSSISLFSETFASRIPNDWLHATLVQRQSSLSQKTTTLVPINGSKQSSLPPKGNNIGSDQWSWFDVDAYGSSQRCLYGILIING